MGSAQSARGIQLGGKGTVGRCGRIPSRDLRPARLALAGRTSSAAVRRDRLWVGLERLGAKVARGSGRVLYSAPRPDLAASRGRGISARCALSAPVAGQGRGPLAPGATVDRGGLSSVRPNRVAPPGRGPAHVHGASGVCGDVGNPPDPS